MNMNVHQKIYQNRTSTRGNIRIYFKITSSIHASHFLKYISKWPVFSGAFT
eukprot:UN24881